MTNNLVIFDDTRKKNSSTNMERDAALLSNLSGTAIVLHFYDWEHPSATFGLFADPYAHIRREAAAKHGLHFFKRPTGGGLLFHLSDFTFSVLVPADHPSFTVNTFDNYAFINQKVCEAILRFSARSLHPYLLPNEEESLDQACAGFCMAKPIKYDVMIGERKISGGAQRRKKQGYLHQGTISLKMLSQEYLQELFLPGSAIPEAMKQNTFSLLDHAVSPSQIADAKQLLKESLIYVFSCLPS